jgi:hypothetical protein
MKHTEFSELPALIDHECGCSSTVGLLRCFPFVGFCFTIVFDFPERLYYLNFILLKDDRKILFFILVS